ncbi:MAG: PEP-CTERM sorting domain-containing protein [Planctomycetaceae bacterium]|jgi:hypothetical protein|nr:PEP-CTERM sorting domain-containing protein [Planctomycetaceae bacterium]
MNTMYRFFVIVLLLGTVISSIGKVYGDTLYADASSRRSYAHYFQMIKDKPTGTGWHNAETLKIFNDDTDQNFRIFCIDYYTSTTTEFNDPFIGQEYNATALDSPTMTLYTQAQKDALNSFFSHVYSTVYDINGDIINDANSYFYQLVVWEIIHETAGTWDIADGIFGIQDAATFDNPATGGSAHYDRDYYNTAVGVINSWLDAITGDITWESIGYGTITDHTLTVYVAEGGQNVSQSFISVVSPTTPEPATILMFGIGIIALPCLRRVRKIVFRS